MNLSNLLKYNYASINNNSLKYKNLSQKLVRFRTMNSPLLNDNSCSNRFTKLLITSYSTYYNSLYDYWVID